MSCSLRIGILNKKKTFKVYLIDNEIHKPWCLFHVGTHICTSMLEICVSSRHLKLLALQFVYNIYYFYTEL